MGWLRLEKAMLLEFPVFPFIYSGFARNEDNHRDRCRVRDA